MKTKPVKPAKRPKHYVNREMGLLYTIREVGNFITWRMCRTNLTGAHAPATFDKHFRPATPEEIKNPTGYKPR